MIVLLLNCFEKRLFYIIAKSAIRHANNVVLGCCLKKRDYFKPWGASAL